MSSIFDYIRGILICRNGKNKEENNFYMTGSLAIFAAHMLQVKNFTCVASTDGGDILKIFMKPLNINSTFLQDFMATSNSNFYIFSKVGM